MEDFRLNWKKTKSLFLDGLKKRATLKKNIIAHIGYIQLMSGFFLIPNAISDTFKLF
jgi:hypothetical protein